MGVQTTTAIVGTSQLLSVPYALYSKSSSDGFASVYSETDNRPVLNNNGNIGIGTANNNAKLDVNGRIVVEPGQALWGSQIALDATSLENGKLYRLTSTGGDAGEGQGKLVIGSSDAGNGMVIDAYLNIGIGTDNPVSKLDVNGEITTSGGNSVDWSTAYGWGNHATAGYVPEPVTETDPVFGASVASAITTTDMINWNNKLDTEVGDISAVYAGVGLLVSGGESGDAYVSANTSFLQQRVNGTCAAGYSIRAISWDGSVTCEPDDIGSLYSLNAADGSPINAVYVNNAGNVGIGTTLATTLLDVNSNSVRIRTQSSPASNADGYTGEIRWDSNYIYICIIGDGPGGATDTWKRAALTGGY